jgi:hypothetical protein
MSEVQENSETIIVEEPSAKEKSSEGCTLFVSNLTRYFASVLVMCALLCNEGMMLTLLYLLFFYCLL